MALQRANGTAESGRVEVQQDFGVLNALAEAVVVIDREGRVTDANVAAARLFGTTAEVLTGRTVWETCWQAVREDGSPFPIAEHPAAVALATGEPSGSVVIGFPRPDGSRLWLLVNACPMPRGSGHEADRVLVTGVDVTGWQADRTKAARLARINAIRAATGRSITRIEDRNELLQAVCQAALTEGHLSMAWIGFTDGSGTLRPAAWAGVELGYLERVRVSVDPAAIEGQGPSGRALRTGEPQVCADISGDATMAPWRDDALRRGFRASAAFPLRTGGTIVGAFNVYAGAADAFDEAEVALLAAVAEDLSFALDAREAAAGERAALDKLRGSEERFRELLESAPDAMVIAAADGTIILVNRQSEAMFGYERSELIGCPVETLIPGQFREAHRVHRQGFFDNHPVARPMGTSLELFGLRRDGTEFPVEISLSPIETDEGMWVSAAVRDITERKREEAIVLGSLKRERELTEQLRELDRMKSDFVSTVSHELRTPLTSMIASVDLLWEPEYGELTDQQRRFVEILDRNCHRLHDLVEDLLHLNQIDAGGLALQRQRVDLADLIERVRGDVAPIAAGKGVDFVVTVGPDLGTALVDGRQVGRVLENLLTNAIKFTPSGGRVTLRGERTATHVRFVVADTGIGIPEPEQQRLFTRFFRSSVATTRAIPGTGLGLVIVKGIVDAHGGTLRVQSALGAGTTVTVSLPLAPPAG